MGFRADQQAIPELILCYLSSWGCRKGPQPQAEERCLGLGRPHLGQQEEKREHGWCLLPRISGSFSLGAFNSQGQILFPELDA